MHNLAMPAAEWALARKTVAACAAPGATLDGRRRRRLAELSRALRSGSSPAVAENPMERFAATLTLEAHRVDADLIAGLRAETVSDEVLVEIVALIARLTAVDTFCFALGFDPVDLPEVREGAPSGHVDARATVAGGWLPTVGPASPPNALSLWPDEHAAMHELHGGFYLEVAAMADLDADRGLHRTQMEFVASRTSLLNECFF